KVSDPTAGCGAVEDLTQQLCAAAWVLFQETEKAGGAPAALEKGLVQEKVAATRAEREKNVARRRDALTGTSEFPDIHEAAVHVLEIAARPGPLPAGGASKQAPFPAPPRIRVSRPL